MSAARGLSRHCKWKAGTRRASTCVLDYDCHVAPRPRQYGAGRVQHRDGRSSRDVQPQCVVKWMHQQRRCAADDAIALQLAYGTALLTEDAPLGFATPHWARHEWCVARGGCYRGKDPERQHGCHQARPVRIYEQESRRSNARTRMGKEEQASAGDEAHRCTLARRVRRRSVGRHILTGQHLRAQSWTQGSSAAARRTGLR